MLQVKNLSAGYKQIRIIHQIDFTMNSGEVTCLLGPNGSGKTTLMRALMGFLPNISGDITIDGQSLTHLSPADRAKQIAYIPQTHVPVFEYTVFDIVLMGRACYLGAYEQPSQNDQDIAYHALEQMGIPFLANKKYTTLSGGQRKLVLIARALCQQARLLIMDEPSSDLDFAHQQLIVQTIRQLKDKELSILLSTHAPELPFAVADQVLMLQQGRIIRAGSPQEVLTPPNLQHIFGVAMDVVNVLDRNGKERRLCLPLDE
jgi:iron complex transport system ATP-binding protein